MSGELVPRKEPIVPEIVDDDDDRRDGYGVSDGALVLGALFSTAFARQEMAARNAEIAADEDRREREQVEMDARSDELRRRVEELLALSEEEGNALLERAFACRHFDDTSGIYTALCALARETGVPEGQLIPSPDLYMITAIDRSTGRRVRFVLQQDSMGVQVQRESKAEG